MYNFSMMFEIPLHLFTNQVTAFFVSLQAVRQLRSKTESSMAANHDV